MYKRSSNGDHQVLVPAILTHEVVRQNHDPPYAAHPGIKRTYNLTALRYWWPGMRKAIESYCCILGGPGEERIMDVVPRGTELELQLRRGVGQASPTCSTSSVQEFIKHKRRNTNTNELY
jgi:hypothetical protein